MPDGRDPREFETEWGPPGLETPSPPVAAALRPRLGPMLGVGFCVLVIGGVPWCQRNIGSVDLMTGNRNCREAPSEIRAWVGNYVTRRAEHAVDLQKWIARHPDRINTEYGAFC